MRYDPLLSLSALAILTSPGHAAAPPPAGPWADVPVGAVLEIGVVVEESTYINDADRLKNMQRTESREVWTVVAKAATSITIDEAIGGATKRETLPLVAEVEPPAPDGHTAQRSDARMRIGEEDLATVFGSVHCTVYRQDTAQLETSHSLQEWRNPAYPVSLKSVTHDGAGAGKVHERSETRTLVRFERGPKTVPQPAPGGSPTWATVAIGTRYVFEVTEERVSDPSLRQAPTNHHWTETWKLVKRDAMMATIEIGAPTGTSTTTVPGVPPTPVEGSTGSKEEYDKVSVDSQSIATAFGTIACTHVTRDHSMIDAGGRDEEWRAPSWPVPVKQVSRWSAKQTTTTTRTLVRVDVPHP